MKPFAEVFQDLYLEEDTRNLMNETQVIRVTMNEKRDCLTVYVDSPRLIQKQIIRDAEHAIEEQIFEDMDVQVSIIERFHLSGQYNARTLYPMYRESMLLELKSLDHVLFSLLHTARVSFTDDDTMIMEMPFSCSSGKTE